eukprot:CAMPEP_0170100458 /NCGR_PEP_ID=MMETSP0020_2-20130122/1664_1 /TAXON_ID=98059 /ORGANISM="Dinobryon sp., Strain UTEXLB2267" /LENGTH=547 /DNA_ID=CAMNT_0010323345 /DNA_START=356 /DNA_END=1996 /DNA_ORIENTATION=+
MKDLEVIFQANNLARRGSLDLDLLDGLDFDFLNALTTSRDLPLDDPDLYSAFNDEQDSHRGPHEDDDPLAFFSASMRGMLASHAAADFESLFDPPPPMEDRRDESFFPRPERGSSLDSSSNHSLYGSSVDLSAYESLAVRLKLKQKQPSERRDGSGHSRRPSQESGSSREGSKQAMDSEEIGDLFDYLDPDEGPGEKLSLHVPRARLRGRQALTTSHPFAEPASSPRRNRNKKKAGRVKHEAAVPVPDPLDPDNAAGSGRVSRSRGRALAAQPPQPQPPAHTHSHGLRESSLLSRTHSSGTLPSRPCPAPVPEDPPHHPATLPAAPAPSSSASPAPAVSSQPVPKLPRSPPLLLPSTQGQLLPPAPPRRGRRVPGGLCGCLQRGAAQAPCGAVPGAAAQAGVDQEGQVRRAQELRGLPPQSQGPLREEGGRGESAGPAPAGTTPAALPASLGPAGPASLRPLPAQSLLPAQPPPSAAAPAGPPVAAPGAQPPAGPAAPPAAAPGLPSRGPGAPAPPVGLIAPRSAAAARPTDTPHQQLAKEPTLVHT